MCRMRFAAVLLRHQVRQRDGLAEFLGSDRRRNQNIGGPQLLRPGAYRGPLPSLWRSSRTRVQRRPATDRSTLLHERYRAQVRTRLRNGARERRWVEHVDDRRLGSRAPAPSLQPGPVDCCAWRGMTLTRNRAALHFILHGRSTWRRVGREDAIPTAQPNSRTSMWRPCALSLSRDPIGRQAVSGLSWPAKRGPPSNPGDYWVARTGTPLRACATGTPSSRAMTRFAVIRARSLP